MKQWIRYIFLFTIPIVLLLTSFNQQARAEGEGESCSIGEIGLEAVPQTLEIGKSQEFCRLGARQLGHVVVKATGTQMVVSWVDITPDTPRDNVFMDLSSGYLGIPMDTSGEWTFAFTPRFRGEFKGTITYKYEYGRDPISKYRDCIDRSFKASLDPKQKIVAEMEIVGPDYRMIDERKKRADDDFDRKKGKILSEMREADGKIGEISREKYRVLEEMRKGNFCSTCGKSRSEFEKMGRDFDEHIREGESEGRYARPATKQELDEKERFFNNQMRPYVSKREAAKARLPALEEEYDQKLREITAQRAAFKAAFDKRLADLKQLIATIETRYEAAKQKVRDLGAIQKVATSRIAGVCHAKK